MGGETWEHERAWLESFVYRTGGIEGGREGRGVELGFLTGEMKCLGFLFFCSKHIDGTGSS